MGRTYILLLISIIFITGCGKAKNNSEEVVVNKNGLEEVTTIIEDTFSYSAHLVDVTAQLSGESQASGIAQTNFAEGVYVLEAKFTNLPEPQENYFYEGWIIRKEPLNIISTGKTVKKNGIYTNTYITEQDLIDHDFYVLTIEPDDKNSAPAEHILEGTLEKINN